MSVRDQEIQRLIHYGKGLGVKIIIYNKSNASSEAEWALDGSQISVFSGPGKTKTGIILDLIHELGHHVWYIHENNRTQDLKFDQAVTRENLYKVETNVPTPKRLRKKIWAVEIAGSLWWDVIYKDTNIKIPKWKLEAAKEFDMWMYQRYYEDGQFPKGKMKRKIGIEIRIKHRNGIVNG